MEVVQGPGTEAKNAESETPVAVEEAAPQEESATNRESPDGRSLSEEEPVSPISLPLPPIERKKVYLDRLLLGSFPGLLKLAQIGLVFVTMVMSAVPWDGVEWREDIAIQAFSAVACFIELNCSIFFLSLVACHLVNKLPLWPWDAIELFATIFCVSLELIMLVTLGIGGYRSNSSTLAKYAATGALFHSILLILYGLDACLKYSPWKEHRRRLP